MANDPTDLKRLPQVPLLITESEEEFQEICDGVYKEIRPQGIIERIYVDEIVDIVWQIIRLKRCKAGVTNLAFHDASAKILYRLMQAGPEIAREWISNPKIAKKVEAELATYKLDSSVIIAEAIRKSACELEPIETLLASMESRRDKTLLRISQYRAEFGAVLRTTSDHLIESKVVELPRAASKKKTRRREPADGNVVELGGAANAKNVDGIENSGNTKKDSAA